jgi:hypothetical protein
MDQQTPMLTLITSIQSRRGSTHPTLPPLRRGAYSHAERNIDPFGDDVDDAIVKDHVDVERRMPREKFWKARHDHQTREGCCRGKPQSPCESGPRAACLQLRFVDLRDCEPGALVKPQTRIRRREGVGRAYQFTCNRSSNCAIVFETAGWPMPSCRAAAENEPEITTRTKVVALKPIRHSSLE